MEEFYPFTSEDIPKLFPIGQRNLISKKRWEWENKTAVSLLLPLTIDMLEDVEGIRALKNTFQVDYDVNSDGKISDGFLKLVKAYLEENNGVRDLSPITELLKTDGYVGFANDLERFFLQYSLPVSEGSENPSNSLTSGSLQAERKRAGGSEYHWNINSVEQAFQNSVHLEGLFKELKEDLVHTHVQRNGLIANDWFRKDRKENAIAFLLPLVIDLLDNVEKIRALKNTFQKEFGENRYAEISDGVLEIVKAYLEENSGTGNLLRMTEVLSSNGHLRIAKCLEKFFLRYSLPASEGSENANIYSLSRDFLHGDKSIAGNSVCVWTSMEQALQYPVILEEIFKKLQLVDQKMFRLVSPTWMEETLSFWRRNARILIQVSKDSYSGGVSLDQFMEAWEGNNKIPEPGKEENAGGKAMQPFKERPFHSIYVSYHHPMDLLSSGETEFEFWRVCGRHIEHLKIENTRLHIIQLYKLIGQDICQNLKQLEIDCMYWQGIPDRNDDPVKKTKVAENLHTLILKRTCRENFLQDILLICPNLKELHVPPYEGTIGALLRTTLNGKFIKLKKLVIIEGYNMKDDFLALRQYIEMLAKNKFDSLEHLKIQSGLSNARSHPFNLYAALALASTLKTLELKFLLSKDYIWNENLDSFMDLSPFPFPNLTKFKLAFYYERVDAPFRVNFDFGTLKGMPMLEKLEIHSDNLQREVLNAQDWVFEGNRNRYLPAGVIVDYQYSAEDSILCSNLKEFTFVGWSLNEEDVRLLTSWFPNLTRLEAELKSEALPIFLDNWQLLDKLVIHTEKLISLRKLRPLKEKKKHVGIIQKILTDGVAIHDGPGVELKQQNGWLFFSI